MSKWQQEEIAEIMEQHEAAREMEQMLGSNKIFSQISLTDKICNKPNCFTVLKQLSTVTAELRFFCPKCRRRYVVDVINLKPWQDIVTAEVYEQ